MKRLIALLMVLALCAGMTVFPAYAETKDAFVGQEYVKDDVIRVLEPAWFLTWDYPEESIYMYKKELIQAGTYWISDFSNNYDDSHAYFRINDFGSTQLVYIPKTNGGIAWGMKIAGGTGTENDPYTF